LEKWSLVNRKILKKVHGGGLVLFVALGFPISLPNVIVFQL
jgi:hypothetical protein